MGETPDTASPLVTILHCRDFLAATGTGIPELLDHWDTSGPTRPPDLVLISGNLAAQAKLAEYEAAYRFLTGLADALGIDHRRIVVVPGVSDVNRLKCAAYFMQCEADDVGPTPPYWEKWQPFSTMIRRFHGSELPKDHPWSLTDFPELRLVVAGFNSTVALTHRPEDAHGRLGIEQIDWFAGELSAGQRRDWLRIGLLHHRPDRPEPQGRLADAELFAARLQPHLDLVVHGQPDEPAMSRVGGAGVPVLGCGAAWQLVEAYPDRVLVHVLPQGSGPGSGVAVSLPHPPPRRPLGPVRSPEPPPALHRLAGQVEQVYRLRFPDSDVTLVPGPDPTRRGYLRISPHRTSSDHGPAEQHPIGICVTTPARADVEWFAGVLARFRTSGAGWRAPLVHGGPAADAELVAWADRHRVVLSAFTDYQADTLLDRFAARQAAWLTDDENSYVPQRGTTMSSAPLSQHVLTWLRDWVDTPRGRMVVVLGASGYGKTFLLRELVRRMHEDGSPTVPILIDLRDFEKAHSLDELVAVHLSRRGQRHIDLDALRYLRREGRVVLLFDGLDQLATRVGHDLATSHLNTFVQATDGRAKIVLTARDQHFLNDDEVLSALGARFGEEGRVVRLSDFDDAQILGYLTRQLHDRISAQDRLDELRNVKDLLGLSRNPRMLSFITKLGAETSTTASAALYQRVIEHWLDHESERLTRLGPGSPDSQELLTAVTRLAIRLWTSPDDSLSLRDLEATAAGLPVLEPRQYAHLLGSSTLLIRSGQGRFTFAHHSILGWLIARHIADELRRGDGGTSGIIANPMPPLMIDFLCQMAGRDYMEDWAKAVLSSESPPRGTARNALEIINYLRVPFERRLDA